MGSGLRARASSIPNRRALGGCGKWLDSPDSQSVGMTREGERVPHEGGEEPVARGMGRRILELKAASPSRHVL